MSRDFMKLPEHYEKWVNVLEKSEPDGLLDPYFKQGVRAMYRKLMADLKPATEALKMSIPALREARKDWREMLLEDAPGFDGPIYVETSADEPLEKAQQALNALKEKGLVE